MFFSSLIDISQVQTKQMLITRTNYVNECSWTYVLLSMIHVVFEWTYILIIDLWLYDIVTNTHHENYLLEIY